MKNPEKRILLVINYRLREEKYFKKISDQLVKLYPNSKILVLSYHDKSFFKNSLLFRPHAVLTFPFTSVGLSRIYLLLKLFYRSRIVCLVTEGGFSPDYEFIDQQVELMAGYDKHQSRLIDADLYWGEEMARLVGELKVRQGKLVSTDRVLVVGYPRYEISLEGVTQIHEAESEFYKKFPKEKRIFFISGFQTADYTLADFRVAGDWIVDGNEEVLLRIADNAKYLRQKFIEKFSALIKSNPDYLFVFKPHPLEKTELYDVFAETPNFCKIPKERDIMNPIFNSGVFFQYGSTSLADSYICRTPSVYFYTEKSKNNFTPLFGELADSVDLDNLEEFFNTKVRRGSIAFKESEKMEKVLKDIFGYSAGEYFCPSKEVAKSLLVPESDKVIFFSKDLISALWWFTKMILLKIYLDSLSKIRNYFKK